MMDEHTKNARQALILIGQILLIFVIVLANYFALQNHSHTVLLYSGRGAAALALFGMLIVIVKSVSSRKMPDLPSILFLVFGGASIGFCLVLTYASLGFSLYDAYRYVTSTALSTTVSISVVALGTLIAGFVLFYVRLKLRCVYGVSEAVVGVIVGSQRFYLDALSVPGTTPTTFLILAILTAGVYLVVRGLDNIHQGLTKPPLDPFAQRFMQWLSAIGKKDSKHGWAFSMSITRQPMQEKDSQRSDPPGEEAIGMKYRSSDAARTSLNPPSAAAPPAPSPAPAPDNFP